MAHVLVKILTSDDGEKRVNPKWHWYTFEAGTKRTLCEGEAFGIGDSRCKFEIKEVTKGGITCPECVKIIKNFKSINL